MARSNSGTPRGNDTLHSADVPDQVVSQVGKAVTEVMKLRQSMEEDMANVQSDEERQDLENQVQGAAVRAISDQGLTVDQYNQVISAAQADPELEERVLIACRAA
jgi:hypothetical protein